MDVCMWMEWCSVSISLLEGRKSQGRRVVVQVKEEEQGGQPINVARYEELMREPLVGEENDDAEGTVRRVLGAVARCQPLRRTMSNTRKMRQGETQPMSTPCWRCARRREHSGK